MDAQREAGEAFFKPVAYSVSKSAILNLTRYLATYWARSGVRVNTLTLAGVWNAQPAEFVEAYTARVPVGRMLEAREAVGALVHLVIAVIVGMGFGSIVSMGVLITAALVLEPRFVVLDAEVLSVTRDEGAVAGGGTVLLAVTPIPPRGYHAPFAVSNETSRTLQ